MGITNCFTQLGMPFGIQMKKEDYKRAVTIAGLLVFAGMLALLVMEVSFATDDYKTTLSGIMKSMIGIVGTIFVAVGVILTVYSVGQLIMAFKNEDADSKSRASTMLVVGVVLICLPTIISSLNLLNYITGKN